MKHKGGRPSDERLKHSIPYIVKKLKVVTPNIVKEVYQKSGNKTSLVTVRKYLKQLADERILRANTISKKVIQNKDRLFRTYELR